MIPVASIERVGRLTYSLGQKLKEQEAEGTYHHNEHEDDREIHSTQTETPKNPFDHNRAIFPSDISKIQIQFLPAKLQKKANPIAIYRHFHSIGTSLSLLKRTKTSYNPRGEFLLKDASPKATKRETPPRNSQTLLRKNSLYLMSSIQSKYRSKAQKPAFIGEYPNSTGYIRAGNLTRRTSPSNNTKPLQGNTRSCRVGRDIVIMIKPEATPVLKIPSTFIPEPW